MTAFPKLVQNEALADNAEDVPVTGYKAIFDVGLDLSDAAVGASDSAGGSGAGGRPGGRP